MKTIDLKDLKTGDILMTSSNTKLSKAIQSFQKLEDKHWGMWSHSGIIWLAYGRIMVIEAQKRGICITPIEHYLKPEFICANNRAAFIWIANNLKFDQLIWEYGNDKAPSWIHVSYKRTGNRNQILRKEHGKRIS